MQYVSICHFRMFVKEVEKHKNDMKFLTLGTDHTKEDKADAEGEDDTPW